MTKNESVPEGVRHDMFFASRRPLFSREEKITALGLGATALAVGAVAAIFL